MTPFRLQAFPFRECACNMTDPVGKRRRFALRVPPRAAAHVGSVARFGLCRACLPPYRASVVSCVAYEKLSAESQ